MILLSRYARGIALFLALGTAANLATAANCKKAMSTGEIEECLAAEQGKTEAKLNRAYALALDRAEKVSAEDGEAPGSRKSLVVAQRAWVRFRDANCEALYTFHQKGSGSGVVYLSCMKKHAEDRIKDLETYE